MDLNEFIIENFTNMYENQDEDSLENFIETYFIDEHINEDEFHEFIVDILQEIPEQYHNYILNTLNWSCIKETIEKFHDERRYVNDDLCLEINYGNCYDAGRHEKATDEDWRLYIKAMNSDKYTKELYDELKNHLATRNVISS